MRLRSVFGQCTVHHLDEQVDEACVLAYPHRVECTVASRTAAEAQTQRSGRPTAILGGRAEQRCGVAAPESC